MLYKSRNHFGDCKAEAMISKKEGTPLLNSGLVSKHEGENFIKQSNKI